jgi:hypothetical protein
MNKTFAAIFAVASAACFSLAAHAQTTTQDSTATTGVMTHSQARDAKNQADAHYDAAKKEADARLDLNKANCESQLNGAQERACKDDAKAQAKKEKADAKVQKEDSKADIKATTK